MIQRNDDSVAAMARRIYADRLRSQLEPDHNDEFVAIEPEPGDCTLLIDEFDLQRSGSVDGALADGSEIELRRAAATNLPNPIDLSLRR